MRCNDKQNKNRKEQQQQHASWSEYARLVIYQSNRWVIFNKRINRRNICCVYGSDFRQQLILILLLVNFKSSLELALYV